jgi:hypothetical protein
MNRYSPSWDTLVDSSLWTEDYYVRVLFTTLLAKKDLDDVVRGSAFNIARWANMTEQEVIRGLKILSSPDKKRLEPQPHEGRRIKKVEDGWLVINGAVYRKKMQELNERARKADWARKHRGAIKNGTPLVGEVAELNGHPVADIDGEVKDVRQAKAGFDPLV